MEEKKKLYLNAKGKTLNERVYTQFAHDVRGMLISLYDAGIDIPMHLVGRPEQIDSFMTALKKEKRYMDSYMRNGLDNHKTMSSKYQLDNAVKQFEYETGLKWPFKN
tara:strand:- start:68 stop:388 length:321 start_codon:yes stop_codon:yes gene_type:complete